MTKKALLVLLIIFSMFISVGNTTFAESGDKNAEESYEQAIEKIISESKITLNKQDFQLNEDIMVEDVSPEDEDLAEYGLTINSNGDIVSLP